jgi:DNA mismatch repair protein MutS
MRYPPPLATPPIACYNRSAMTDDATPIRRQYLKFKQQYPDAILFFRLGDFYETFDDDAHLVHRELELTLTSRPVAKGQRVPMAGVPHHAVDNYVARLIAKGYRVAICEQIGEQTRGLFKREVVRVITPGTVVEPGMLPDSRNNYLAALIVDGENAGLAYADITTGEFATTQIALGGLAQEMARLQPAELLVEDLKDTAGELRLPDVGPRTFALYPLPGWRFELGRARQTLLQHFQVATLAGFGCEQLPLAARAAGALVEYLRSTQAATLAQLTTLRTYNPATFMAIDPATRRNLELTETIRNPRGAQGALLGALDATVTPMGARLLRQRVTQPLLGLAELNARLDRVQALVDDAPLRAEIAARLKGLPDIERLTNRLAGAHAGPRDLVALRRALDALPGLAAELARAGDGPLGPVARAVDPLPDLAELLARAVADDPPAVLDKPGTFRPGYSAELDGVVAASRDARTWIAELEPRERERTGIRTLKVGYNRVFGYYIEVSHAQAGNVPDDYIRKQTLTNGERYITPDLKEYESLVLNAEDQILGIERKLFTELCTTIAGHAARLLVVARALAALDVYAALATVAVRNRYVRPQLTQDDVLDIRDGRHPVVELALRDVRFVPNDVRFDANERLHVITGPNMSGKSTFLRQVALIVLMAQIGSFVPAESATIGLVDRIFTRIGAQDEIAAGQSTFMVEMVETAYILAHSSTRSLIVLDEVGRGTSTYDGIAIARALVEYLHNNPRLSCKTLFATHYHELIELEQVLPRVRNYNVAVAEEEGRVVFLHKVVPGGADRSYGIHVAQLAGLPRAVINRATEVLGELEAAHRGDSRAPGVPASAGTPAPVAQLSLFGGEPHPVVLALRALSVDELSPLEALTKLYELQQAARQS